MCFSKIQLARQHERNVQSLAGHFLIFGRTLTAGRPLF